jgi:hypothetical protein
MKMPHINVILFECVQQLLGHLSAEVNGVVKLQSHLVVGPLGKVLGGEVDPFIGGAVD